MSEGNFLQHRWMPSDLTNIREKTLSVPMSSHARVCHIIPQKQRPPSMDEADGVSFMRTPSYRRRWGTSVLQFSNHCLLYDIVYNDLVIWAGTADEVRILLAPSNGRDCFLVLRHDGLQFELIGAGMMLREKKNIVSHFSQISGKQGIVPEHDRWGRNMENSQFTGSSHAWYIIRNEPRGPVITMGIEWDKKK